MVYLDLSAAARGIAEARAKTRGLTNIRFLTGSIFDLPQLAPGPYDYIDCCGMLHHLPDPDAGLAALSSQLAGDGGIGLMVYGEHGRDGVYPLQVALRQLIGEDETPQQKTAVAKRLLAELPDGNAFRRNPFIGDHTTGDAGLYDLLLHSQDRAYTVPQLYALTAGAGLAITAWIEPCRYDPLSYLKDESLRARAAGLQAAERAALAERLSGAMKTHVVYAVPPARAAAAVARPAPDLVPWLNGIPPKALADTLAKRGELAISFHTERFVFPAPADGTTIAALIDGRRSLGDIAAALSLAWDDFLPRYIPLHDLLTGINKLYLRIP